MQTKPGTTMKASSIHLFYLIAIVSVVSGCGKLGKSKSAKNDGQLHGVAAGPKYSLPKPPGMVYIPSGTFHMGPSDEDLSYINAARNKQVSINGFWMDQTEITNDEYRQFVQWVRDSIALTILGKIKGTGSLDWTEARKIKWSDSAEQATLARMFLTSENRINGRREIDANSIIYHSEVLDYKKAAQRRDPKEPPVARVTFIEKKDTPIYPDTLVWIRDFTYSYNEPMAKKYFSHPAYGNYPVVGVSWEQATAFCEWRTHYLNSFLESKKKAPESDFRLPTEAEWEYAARGGRSQVSYPWGGPYLRNKKGCLLANFKPGRGNYPEDGGFYTVRADAYWPNDFGLYNMSGNVAEWTSSLYYIAAYQFQDDKNPDIRYNATRKKKDGSKGDPPRMLRKVIRGGSWKDIGYYLQVGTRAYEYQDTTKSYIGFRCVIDLPPTETKKSSK